MDDLVGWLWDAVCGWFAVAPPELVSDPGVVGAAVAAEVAAAAGGHAPNFLAHVLGRVAAHAADGAIDAAAVAVKRNLAGRPPAVRAAAAAFLTRIPENVRATFRRPADPRGLTVPPGLSLLTPADLAPLLAGRLPRFKPGQRPLAGVDLELVALLGVGGFGEVWKAVNPHLPGVPAVALKFCTDPAAARLLRHEAAVLDRVLRAGPHPGVVALRHTYLSADPPALEYEFVPGGDLAALIPRWHAAGRPDPDQAVAAVLQIARAVGFAHRQTPPIVHRDLKPSNVLVDRAADGRVRLRVADFGIGAVAAGLAGSPPATRGGTLATVLWGSHTPLYASPQQQAGGRPDPRDDVYALGVIWFQFLTGDLGSGAPTGRRWADDLTARGVPPAHLDLLAACVEPKPEHRPPDAAALADELAARIEVGARPTRPTQPRVVLALPDEDDTPDVELADDEDEVEIDDDDDEDDEEGDEVVALSAETVWAANLPTLGLFGFYQIPALCRSVGVITGRRRVGFGAAVALGVCTLGVALLVLLYLAAADLERHQDGDPGGHPRLGRDVGLYLVVSLIWAVGTLGIGIAISAVASTYAIWVVQRQVNHYAAT